MRFNIVTLFPEFFSSPLAVALMGKAQENAVIDVALLNPRDTTEDRHHTVDDRPYGGGPGMVMMVEPLRRTLDGIVQSGKPRGRILMMSPAGKPFSQAMARDLAKDEAVTILCGRYEGFDARIHDLYDIEPVSMGDFVLNGGETAALAVMEAVGRLVTGFMGKEESGTEESFSEGLLEYPHYTRPEVLTVENTKESEDVGKNGDTAEAKSFSVPEILRSGDHGRIAAWRRTKALEATVLQRPDLLPEAKLTEDDMDTLRKVQRIRVGRNLFCALVHFPVMLKGKNTGATSLTNLDVHDIGRSSCTYGLGGFYVSTPIEDQKALLATLLQHWTEGAGAKSNPDRAEALGRITGVSTVQEAIEDVTKRTGQSPFIVGTSARGAGDISPSHVREILEERPVLLLFGTGHGLAPELLDNCDAMLRPLRWMDGYNHLSVRAAAAIILDRLLGDAY
ncbi:MAG: tRNA (guanosine(37)-N1)-methyltransferase TrmD [Pseudomonadota bacterium]